MKDKIKLFKLIYISKVIGFTNHIKFEISFFIKTKILRKKIYTTPKGYDQLWSYFGLSYASWITVPRVLCHEMPDKWQKKMAKLLKEFDNTFDYDEYINYISLFDLDDDFDRIKYLESDDDKAFSYIKKHLKNIDSSINNYKYPDREFIEKCRRIKGD